MQQKYYFVVKVSFLELPNQMILFLLFWLLWALLIFIFSTVNAMLRVFGLLKLFLFDFIPDHSAS